MTQHQDPLVYNADTGEWQNASNLGPSGVPLGMTIGDPTGSVISMQPDTGLTISIDGGPAANITSAFQASSGAASENVPAYTCAIVIHPGAGNEQLGHLTVSGLNASSAQATVMTSESNDGSIHGAIRHGTLSPGGSTDYAFTTIHTFFPHSLIQQTGPGWGVFATDPWQNTGAAEVWNNLGTFGLNPGYKNGWSSNIAGEYNGQVRFSPLHDGVLFFRGVLQTPPVGTNVNSTQVCSAFPTTYRPQNTVRWTVNSLASPGSTGYGVLDTSGVFIFRGLPAANGVTIDITGHAHIG